MSSSSGLTVTKPISVWNKPLKTNFKDLFKALGKAGVDAATGQWIGLGKDAVDVLSAIGLDSKNPAELSWALIYNSLSRATFQLVAESQFLMKEVPVDIATLTEQLDLSLETSELQITANFFEHPEQLSVVSRLQTPVKQWLMGVGLDAVQSETVSNRLPAYFTFALHEEWRRHSQTYSSITAAVKTPFTEATEREQGWRLYASWLQKQIEEPMMFEAFGLKDVYIPLRGYYKRQQPSQESSSIAKAYESAEPKPERVVVDLATELRGWLRKAEQQDAIRVISGGPGAGKSSFAKVYAAEHAQRGEFPVLFVPLHQFTPTGDLVKAVDEFIRYDHYLKHNPLDPESEGSRLLVIFDGLDELALQGKIARETAQSFVREVQDKVSRFNYRTTRLQVIITGREVVVQESFREQHQILHVLPYLLPKNERKEVKGEPYIDPNGLLSRDQRGDWWSKYGVAVKQNYSAMPGVLKTASLTEITAQPLLNYLVALSYVAGKLTLSAATNLNTVYADLLDAVYERGYEDSGRHRALTSMSKAHFIRVLEEIALAAWHGGGRTTTIQEIELHCERSGLSKLLSDFEEGAELGVTRLLVAFYFRQSGQRSDQRTFEFTHKSFSEYLTARRIVRAVSRIQKQLARRAEDIEEGWSQRDALQHWAEVCGPTRIDVYLLDFLRDEVALCPVKQVAKWQKTFSELIAVMLRRGMPMEKIEPSLRFYEANQRAIHAEEALLAVLGICSSVTKDISTVEWPTRVSFGAWIGRLQGQRVDVENLASLCSLVRLNLSSSVLINRDLMGADLREANLREANLREANLSRANLRGADLSGANLSEANLSEADLRETNLRLANLRGAILLKTNLREARNVTKEQLIEALLCNTCLREGISLDPDRDCGRRWNS